MGVMLEPGMILTQEDLMLLRKLIPLEIWRTSRGLLSRRHATRSRPLVTDATPCRSSTAKQPSASPANRKSTTTATCETTRLACPFRPIKIDPEDRKSPARWAFNLQHRYIGAGVREKFRITDFPNSVGAQQTYEGSFFLLRVAHRADLADTDYGTKARKKIDVAAGGEFDRPFNARHLAWRQFRPTKASRNYSEPDDVFTYIPTMRKVRRAAASWVAGMYLPRYTATGDSGGGGMAFGDGGSISPTAGRSIAVSEDIRRGFVGMTLRANAYAWRIAGETDVLAPLNASEKGYPEVDAKNFGTSGLSLASDRWDLRHAIILEGALRVENLDVAYIKIYVDYQTLQPLYWITRTKRQRLLDVGALAYRFSDDLPNATQWPGGIPASVFYPVAASFYDAGSGAGGWRRESYRLEMTPVGEHKQRAMTTSDSLSRGR